MKPCPHIERTHLLGDGELSGRAAAEACDHLVVCASCRAELADLLQLAAVIGEPTRLRAQVIPIAWYRDRHLRAAAVVLAAAAIVAITLAMPRSERGKPAPVTAGLEITLAPTRAVEARLSWPGAAGHRAYDVPRAGKSPHEAIDLPSLAEVSRRGDAQGAGVLALLDGDLGEAARHLERAGDSTGALADRAALALADHQPARALALTDAALARDPRHGPALWNRALALRDLGLVRAAAAAFREAARRGEPGWADEATQRARLLDDAADAAQRRFDRIDHAGALTMLSPGDVRAQPGLARGVLYDALRSASSLDQLAALQPLVDAVDAADRGTAMTGALARARAALRPELSRTYGELLRSPRAAPAGFLAALRAAHADDLRIGALGRIAATAADVAELGKLTAASPDPWLLLVGLEHQARWALDHDDPARAEAILVGASHRCPAAAPAFRCVMIGKQLGALYLQTHRLPEARAALTAAWASARTSGEWILEAVLLPHLVVLASLDPASRPLARAYRDEIAARPQLTWLER